MITLFWILICVVVYTYIIYPGIVFILSEIILVFRNSNFNQSELFEPEVTLFVTAYNEIDFVDAKVQNSFSLDYPKEKLHFVWITDGSDDGTYEALKKYKELSVYHETERKGKINALNRGMQFVKTPIVIFSDANTLLNKESIRAIVQEFKNEKNGCVTGRKRIIPLNKDNAVNSGEGIYWQYESLLKKAESNVNSAIGAVGELFAIRTELFEAVESDTILDDFIISLQIAQKGYQIKFASNAIASERASISIHEELKRKIRIAYGGFQTLFRLKKLLNPFYHLVLTLQYISHKVLRWAVVPFSYPMLFLINIYLVIVSPHTVLYNLLFVAQSIFYLFVFAGYILQSKRISFKLIFVPYYLFIMNLSVIAGFIRFLKKSQSVNWERSERE